MSLITRIQRETVCRNIKKFRELRYPGLGGMTKCSLTLNVSLQQWSHWENGRRMPSSKNLKMIAVVLGVSENDLLVDDAEADDNAAVIAVTEGMREFLDILAQFLILRKNGVVRVNAAKKIRDYAMSAIADAEAN